jgi:hypothetical protein
VALTTRKETDMAIKPTITTRRKSSNKGRDLAARKDLRGGAQKKEKPAQDAHPRGGSVFRSGKRNLS